MEHTHIPVCNTIYFVPPLILDIHILLEIKRFQYFREVFMRNILATPTATKCTIIVPRCFTMVHEHLTLETLIKILAEF